MIFSYNLLQSLFDKKLPKPEKLAEVLTMHSFEVESLARKGGDWLLDIDVTPNRASDCFSHIGIAREIAAILKYKFKTPAFVKTTAGKKDFIKIEVKDKNACPRYTAKVITDVKVGDSPKWIKERLEVCGLQPINNVVDIANYMMLETGQPLHAFDFDKLEGKKIIVRFAKQGEKIITLDNQKFDLNKNILIIADSKQPLAIAGIKGGKKAEIDKNTKTIVLESANFDYKSIRLASRLLNLKTDASWRFEHGLDPNLTEQAINRAASLILEIAKGKVAKGLSDFYPKKVFPKKIKLDLNYVEKLLGVKIPQKEIIKIFQKLDFTPINQCVGAKEILLVEVPTFRLDISIPEDLIEEIGRIYGYEKIKPIMPLSSLIPPKKNENIFWQDFIKNILKELCFTEVYNYSFVSEKDREIFTLKDNLVEIENPMSVEQKYLRPTLLINLLKNIKSNIKNYEEMKLFEIGKKHTKNSGRRIDERAMFSGIIIKKDKKELFYELKGVIDLLLNKLGISDIWYDEHKVSFEDIKLWHLKKCAEIKIKGEKIGFLGEISPNILDALKIKKNVCAFEIDFEKLKELCSEESEYQPIPLFPTAVRDLAVLVPRKVKVVDVLNKINISGGALVRDVDLFDMYEGKELPEDKKNLAFHIIYQAKDRTLSAREIDEVHNRIIKNLEKNPTWEVRK
ncbi:phenylalanine--tRNA ligase subunit beta [Candidatus Parcubacteria bacterium]|nr:phenylalanine--tRNA ligase subunit beta [Candidatus Parcubacteria bacterium]